MMKWLGLGLSVSLALNTVFVSPVFAGHPDFVSFLDEQESIMMQMLLPVSLRIEVESLLAQVTNLRNY